MSFNQVTFMGNVTRDVDFKVFESGTCVAKFGLAMNERYTDRDGEQQEDVCFVDIEVWGRQAEIASEYLFKGKKVLVTGSLKQERWETEGGQKRSRHIVRGHRIVFASTRAEEEGMGQSEGEGNGSDSQTQRESGSNTGYTPPTTPAPAPAPTTPSSDEDIPF